MRSYTNEELDIYIGSIEFYGAPAYDEKGVGTPTNITYTVGSDNTSLEVTATPSNNATQSMLYLEREVTPTQDLATYNLIAVDGDLYNSQLSGLGGTYDDPNPFFCIQDMEYGLMGEQASHWLNVADQVPSWGFEAFPYLQNKLNSYGGFETFDYDVSVNGTSLKFIANVKGQANTDLKVSAYALNKTTNQYESVKSTTTTINNTTKNITFSISNSEIDATKYDPKYVQIRTQVISTSTSSAQYEVNGTVYFNKWAIDLLNVPAGCTFREPCLLSDLEITNGVSKVTLTEIPMVSDNTASYKYYYKLRDIILSTVFGVHNISEMGAWTELKPIEVEQGPEAPTFEYNNVKYGDGGEFYYTGTPRLIYYQNNTLGAPTYYTVTYADGSTKSGSMTPGADEIVSEGFSIDATKTGVATITAYSEVDGVKSDVTTIKVTIVKLQAPTYRYGDAAYTDGQTITLRGPLDSSTNKVWIVNNTPGATVHYHFTLPNGGEADKDFTGAEGFFTLGNGYGTYTIEKAYAELNGDKSTRSSITIIVKSPVETVAKENTKFRDDADSGWLVGGLVPSAKDNVENSYLTIWYDGVDANSHESAWNNHQSGNDRYSNSKVNTPARSRSITRAAIPPTRAATP